jgi:hypothetical protein
VKRRIFIKMSTAGVAYAAIGPAVPWWPMTEPGAVPIEPEVASLGFPLKVRPVGHGGPLTPWIATTNNARQLIIEDMAPCRITGIEVSIQFPDLGDFQMKHIVPLVSTFDNNEQQKVTLVWDKSGIIDPIID